MNDEGITEHFQASCPGCAHRWMPRRVVADTAVPTDDEIACPVCTTSVRLIRLASYRGDRGERGTPGHGTAHGI